VAGGKVENVFRLQIMNATEQEQEFSVEAAGLAGMQALMDQSVVVVGPAQSRWVAVRVQIPHETVAAGSHPFAFSIATRQNPAKVLEKSVFIVPR